MKPPRSLMLVLLAAAATADEEPAAAPARLLDEARCVACHASPARSARPAPSLERAGARLAPGHVRAVLRDGHAPDVLAGLGGEERTRAIEALTHFLADRGGPLDAAPVTALPFELQRGRALYHELGCVACHGPQEEPWRLELDLFEAREWEAEEPGEPFDPPRPIAGPEALARETTVGALTRFVGEEHAPALRVDGDEARALALYLLREQALGESGGPGRAPGLVASYYEAPFEDPAPEFDALRPLRQERVDTIDGLPEHRDDHFGFRFAGELAVGEAGEYVFATTSDDGSRLYVDGELVVQNDGFHGMSRAEGAVTLEPGRHALEVTYFERDGGEGLEVRWSGPGFEERRLDADELSHAALEYRVLDLEELATDPALVAEGARLYDALRCDACHAPGKSAPPAKPLATLDPEAAGGCLGGEAAGPGPRYDLDGPEREALRAALSRLDEPTSPEARLAELLERNACTACHARKGAGGPPRSLWPYFVTRGHADLGDEGRIPPTLDEAGNKLRPAALRAVLLDGATARPYMAARMPRFPADEAAEIAELLLELDARPAPPEPEFSPETVEHGRRLAGVKGLACIQCHDFAGHPSLGIPAVDLATAHERLSYDWFARLLNDPISLNMNTRMPEFWASGVSPVADVLGGDPARQVEALWTYLSLGASMPLPDGLVVEDEVYELVPRDRVVTCGVFMEGVSPRTLVVGFPEGVHYAFDVQNSRLAKVWRGRFFNARGTWEGRAGVLQSPPVDDVLDLPPGPAVAALEMPDAPWPTEDAPRALGRGVDAHGVPGFRYSISGADGRCEIRESLYPVLAAGGSRMMRRLRASDTDCGGRPFCVRVAAGDEIVETGDGAWRVDGELTVRVLADDASMQIHVRPYLVGGAGWIELRALMPSYTRTTLRDGVRSEERGAALKVELSW